MTSDPWPLWGLIIVLILIAASGYFTASIRAIGSTNKLTIREKADAGDKRAAVLLTITDNLRDYELAVRAFGMLNYLICFLIVSFIFFHPLSKLINMYVWHSQLGSAVLSFAVLILICSIFFFSLAEVFPKRLGVLHDTAISLSTSSKLCILATVMKPVTVAAKVIDFLFLKLFRQRTDIDDNEYSEVNIVEMLEAGQERGELKEEGKKMITGVFAFDDILAYEIMTPRTDVFAIDINDPADEYIDELMELRFSRIPVYEDDTDNIIGILYIKDYLIKAREDGFDNVDLHSILRKPYYIPETKNIDSLFFELQKSKQHIAILIDEYGGFCGIVTMEDIIEEVMGDIDDEYDVESQEIKRIGKDLYVIEGGTSLDDINEELSLDLTSEDSETIGGFIIDMFGEIPDEDDIGKEIFYDHFVFTIKSVKDRRIEEVTLKILPVSDKETDNEQQ